MQKLQKKRLLCLYYIVKPQGITRNKVSLAIGAPLAKTGYNKYARKSWLFLIFWQTVELLF